jgi:acyl-CoA synthetase (AMP-forming)/AMP-acid ligase II/thioesterase domain-containing protein
MAQTVDSILPAGNAASSVVKGTDAKDAQAPQVSVRVLTPPKSPQEATSLEGLLHLAADSAHGCTFYTQGGSVSKTTSYADLYASARSKASIVNLLAGQQGDGGEPPIVLLHFDSIEDNITWFWATVLAGLTPAVSTPLPTDLAQRRKHLDHIATLLNQPLVLTTKKLVSEVDATQGFNIKTIEEVTETVESTDISKACSKVLMLTSGSSGNAKAVELEPMQLIASMKSKSARLGTTSNDTFLNWIGFDHVANLTECHLHAMFLSVDQFHVPAGDVISEPWLFLDLIDKHRITRSFAPNFFLARLVQALESSPAPRSLDLSCLKRINSGGEANLVDTAARVTNALKVLSETDVLVTPGFGMTETCAGSIYHLECPDYDVPRKHEFTSLGKTVPGMQMRIRKEDGTNAAPNELGYLQVTGEVVFKRYHNNDAATAESFTDDGWFKTGDKAVIDETGRLSLSGRDKEVINLNGVKYAPHEIEAALEDVGGEIGITPSFTAVFSIRPHNAQQEEICVLYHPSFQVDDIDARVQAAEAITRVVGTRTSTRPKHIVPLPTELLPKSALGKLSRAKLRTALEKGEFAEYEDRLDARIKAKREAMCEEPSTETEKLVMEELLGMLEATYSDQPVGVNNSIFDFGVTSTDLFLLGARIQKRAGISQEIPVGTLVTDPTIRGIAAAIDELGNESTEYVPIVPLQKEGSKTPLFLVHPGSGDVLIFVALAKYFPDRPIYGIRTKDLYAGTDYHKTLHGMAQCYTSHIRKIQPTGPYAIAGYSLGSSVAYEIAKLLELMDEQVPFLGILDSPPHIRHLIGEQDFIDVLLNVAYFLELITEEYAMVESTPMHELSDYDALETVLKFSPPERLSILSIDHERLRKITEVTKSFGSAGRYYEPDGMVSNMDVFWVHPLLWVAGSRKEWMEEHLSKWVSFVKEAPVYHECDGVHSKMLNADFVDGTAKRIRATLQARGV